MKPEPFKDRIGLSHANKFAMWGWYYCFLAEFWAGYFARPWDFVVAGLPTLFLSYLGARASQDMESIETTRFLFRTSRHVQTVLVVGAVGLVLAGIWWSNWQIKGNDFGYINYLLVSVTGSIAGLVLATFGALVDPRPSTIPLDDRPTDPTEPKGRPAPIIPKLPTMDASGTMTLPREE